MPFLSAAFLLKSLNRKIEQTHLSSPKKLLLPKEMESSDLCSGTFGILTEVVEILGSEI